MQIYTASRVVVISLALATSAAAQSPQELIDKLVPNELLYHLKSTIERIGSEKRNTERNHGRTVRSVNRAVNETVKINACGQGGRWMVSGADWSYLDLTENESGSRSDSTICPPPPEAMKHSMLYRQKHYPPDIRKPGDSSTQTLNIRTTLYTGIGAPDLITSTGASLVDISADTVLLSMRAHAFLHTISIDLEERKRVCVGGVVRIETSMKTCEIGCIPRHDQTPPTDNGSSVIVDHRPPMPWMQGFSVKIKRPTRGGASVSGSKILEHKKPAREGGYEERTVASWSAVATSQCEQVRAFILQDLLWTEAYLDRSLQQGAGVNTKLFVERVTQQVYKKGGGKGDKGEATVEIEVDKDCVLRGADAFRDASQDACQPSVVPEAVLAHEQRHVQQCLWGKKNADAGSSGGKPGHNSYAQATPEEYGLNEAAAHLVGIGRALSWYEDNCPDDGEGLRRRFVAAQQKLAAR